MTDLGEDARVFSAVLNRILAAASTIPEVDRVGFVKGMIQATAEIKSAADREALFQFVVLVASSARTTTPPGSPINVSQTFAPQQIISQTSAGVNVTPSASEKSSWSLKIAVAAIGAIALIAAALITARFSTTASHPTTETVGPLPPKHRSDSAPVEVPKRTGPATKTRQ